MPKAYPRECRDDVVAVAQRRESGWTIKEIVGDFGILRDLPADLAASDRRGGRVQARLTSSESAELREMRKRNRLLEQENEILLRAAAYLSQANLKGKGSSRS